MVRLSSLAGPLGHAEPGNDPSIVGKSLTYGPISLHARGHHQSADIDFRRIVADMTTFVKSAQHAWNGCSEIVVGDGAIHLRQLPGCNRAGFGQRPCPLHAAVPGVIMAKPPRGPVVPRPANDHQSGVDVVGSGGLLQVRSTESSSQAIDSWWPSMTKHRRGRLVNCRFQGFVGESVSAKAR
jgi:hypothetical protein